MRFPFGFMGFMALAITVTVRAAEPIPDEPFYKGKPLSYWLTGLVRNAPTPPSPDEALAAVRALGVPAISFILQFNLATNRYERRSGWVVCMATAELFFTTPFTNQVRQAVVTGLMHTNRVVQMNAMESLHCPSAAAVLPRLKQLANSSDPQVREIAFYTIGRCLGEEAAREATSR